MENKSNITLFDYKNIKVRTVIIDGEIWFVAKDVCDILELTNPTESLRTLSDKMKMTLEGKESILSITEDPNTVRILFGPESLVSADYLNEKGAYKIEIKGGGSKRRSS